MRRLLSFGFLLTMTLSTVAPVAQAQPARSTGPGQTSDTSNGEWRELRRGTSVEKYSPLDQIDARNFATPRNSLGVDVGRRPRQPLDTIVESLVEKTPSSRSFDLNS